MRTLIDIESNFKEPKRQRLIECIKGTEDTMSKHTDEFNNQQGGLTAYRDYLAKKLKEVS